MRRFVPLFCVGLLAFGVFNIAQGAAKKFTIFYACDAEPGSGSGEPDGMVILNHNNRSNVPGDAGVTTIQLVMADFQPNTEYELEMVGFGFAVGIWTDDKGQATFHGGSLGDITSVNELRLWSAGVLRASTVASSCP